MAIVLFLDFKVCEAVNPSYEVIKRFHSNGVNALEWCVWKLDACWFPSPLSIESTSWGTDAIRNHQSLVWIPVYNTVAIRALDAVKSLKTFLKSKAYRSEEPKAISRNDGVSRNVRQHGRVGLGVYVAFGDMIDPEGQAIHFDLGKCNMLTEEMPMTPLVGPPQTLDELLEAGETEDGHDHRNDVTLIITLHNQSNSFFSSLPLLPSMAKVVLITGTSSGLGHHLALESIKAGYRVIATTRRRIDVPDLVEAGASIIELDVTISEAQIREFAAEAIAIYGQIDYLINNAGKTFFGTVEETSLSTYKDVFNTNFWSALHITKAFLPHFRERRTGTVVQISSVTVEVGFGGLAAYSASKAALSGRSLLNTNNSHNLTRFLDKHSPMPSEQKCQDSTQRSKNQSRVAFAPQPGLFRTPVAKKAGAGSSTLYPEMRGLLSSYAVNSGKEPGDPEKGARRVVELISVEGALPQRLPLGDAANELTGKKLDERIRAMRNGKSGV
ncbi:MAG: hypothetical protein CYPHOPRED_003690, partial [Cyphobasidiales sp. Tagirdzhanova-0007]